MGIDLRLLRFAYSSTEQLLVQRSVVMGRCVELSLPRPWPLCRPRPLRALRGGAAFWCSVHAPAAATRSRDLKILYLTQYYLDRYLTRDIVNRTQLAMVGNDQCLGIGAPLFGSIFSGLLSSLSEQLPGFIRDCVVLSIVRGGRSRGQTPSQPCCK